MAKIIKDYVDISKHQGNVDFKVMKKAKIEGVILRAAYSKTKDVKFDSYYEAARKAGFEADVCYIFSTAHYITHSTNLAEAKAYGAAEIKALANTLKGKAVKFIALDFELEKNCKTCLNKKNLTALANYMADLVRNYGYTPLIYSSISWFRDMFNASDLNCKLWVAYYCDGYKVNASGVTFPNTTYGKLMTKIADKIELWQYSSTGGGKTFGVSSACIDLNYRFVPEPVKVETPKPATPKPVTSKYYPKTSYKGVSLVDGLKSIKVTSTFANRKKIAKANGIKLYLGTSSQNTKLLNLLKKGKLVKA